MTKKQNKNVNTGAVIGLVFIIFAVIMCSTMLYRDTINDVQPLCQRCNSKKGAHI